MLHAPPTPVLPTSGAKRLRLTKATGFSCVILAFGLLLWARFIIVTGHPRTAVAEPAVQQAQAQPEVALRTEILGSGESAADRAE